MYPKIADINFFLPKKTSLKKKFKSKNHFNKVFEKTGIANVSIADENQTALDLAIKSSKKVLRNNKKKIDCIIYVTQSPEYNLPSGSCILQDKLGLSKDIRAFDVNQGCSGFVYGLSLASSLIENNQSKNLLLVCADTYRKYIKDNQNSCFPIFSDGASSTIISKN